MINFDGKANLASITIGIPSSTIMISILIAARNEEATIIPCLEAINNLYFPQIPFEVLIGNDGSEDRTADLVEEFIRNKPNFRLFTITRTVGLARGKANVLAQLAHQANGRLLCITDADVEVPSTWLSGMCAAYQSGVGIVTGITLVKGKTVFHHLQALDWVYALGFVKIFSDWQIPTTAMGNNMLITREAYQSVGGYENLPFSVTEDFALFQAIVRKNYSFRYVLSSEVKAYTQPIRTIAGLLHQRKRWMVGAMQLPFNVKWVFFLHALALPILLWLSLFSPHLMLTLLLVKTCLDTFYLLWVLSRIQELALLKYVLIFEVYLMLFSLATLVYYYMPGKVVWKGRIYDK